MADQLEERANSGKYRRVADLAMHSVASQAHQQAHRLAVQTEGSAANQLEVRRSARHSEVVHQLVMHPEEVLEALGAMAMVDLLEGLAGRSEVDSKYLVVEKATLRGDLAVHPRVVRGLQEEDQWASRLANWLAECYLATRPEDLLGGPKEVLREDRLTGGKVVLRMAANWWVGLLATQSAFVGNAFNGKADGSPAGRPAGRLGNCDKSVGNSVGWSVGKSMGRPADSPFNGSADGSADGSAAGRAAGRFGN
jgi:hypothetical protein